MNGTRSDASTSTEEDLRAQPLCLFYFTHPFGVLSPEPPTLAAAPAHVARAFINMEPVSPMHFWPPSTSDAYDTAPTSSSQLSFDLGNAKVHKNPVNVVGVAKSRKCTIELGARSSLSSSLLSSDVWFSSSSGSRGATGPRRLVPYHRILPPLHLPVPQDSSPSYSSDDIWPIKCLNPAKFSLPPIEMPVQTKRIKCKKVKQSDEVSSVDTVNVREVKCRRRMGVSKHKRRRHAVHLSGVRRLVTRLLTRAVKGRRAGSSSSPALLEVLSVIREAWAEPRSLFDTRCAVTRMSYTRQKESTRERSLAATSTLAPAPPPPVLGMAARAQLAELPPRPGVSPGLLRRRYSVPETIMRKYRLAQQRSDSEESGLVTSPSPASASPARGSCSSLCEGGPAAAAARSVRREREVVRRSALLRRLWGRGACCCETQGTRSLGGSHAELRPLTSPSSSRHSHAAPWASPKRQRLDSRDFRGSDEMIRAAMRNSYDRTEEARSDRLHRAELSESTYPDRDGSYADTTEPMTDCDTPFDIRCERNGFAQYSDKNLVNPTPQPKACLADETPPSGTSGSNAPKNDYSYTDTSDAFSTSTTRDTNGSIVCKLANQTTKSAHIDGRISERSVSVDNDEKNILPYDTPLTVDTPSYELLEIVVSETSNGNNGAKNSIAENGLSKTSRAALPNPKVAQNINIDEYVSNILVESLNSLTDQLEGMNASIGNDRKISIVEKEIKVKLQNTGVNTIVHLSPTSNNQIIFGNEELCNNDGRKDNCNNPQDCSDTVAIREETASVESNNNEPASMRHDAVNHAVLQQIQKLFQDELHHLDAAARYPPVDAPAISHIEISNVDVYIDDNTDAAFGNNETIEMHTQNASDLAEFISGIGAGNYYEDPENGAVVPRFSAYPHTESMEVNTSSSEDADIGGSDCTSLVDSLDDPNSPRSLLLRRSFNSVPRRSELVRSAIDVLDLLPEDAMKSDRDRHRDKGEAFFIRIKDDNCDCEKENVVVAEHMPEKIRQRLYRRHRRRELRMECARRGRPSPRAARPARADRPRSDRESRALLDTLIGELIDKIAHDEYKCMRIKQKPTRMVTSKSDENISKRCCKRDVEYVHRKEALKMTRNGSMDPPKDRISESKSERHHVRGKMSFLTHPNASGTERGPKRIYQKSEIHDGNKCIEILEILEYVNGSQSSPETTNSDENQSSHNCRSKKSRIPVPVSERIQKSFKSSSKRIFSDSIKRLNSHETAVLGVDRKKSNNRETTSPTEFLGENETGRRAPEPRSRSNSLRFRRVFDSIPEERSSLSIDSSNEDVNHNRRASAPNVIENLTYRGYRNGNGRRSALDNRCGDSTTKESSTGTSTETRSTGTSPLQVSVEAAMRQRCQTTMTSPQQRSAATSPLRSPPPAAARPPAPPPAPPRHKRPPQGLKSTDDDGETLVERYERELASARSGCRESKPGDPTQADDSISVADPKSNGAFKSTDETKSEMKLKRATERSRSESRSHKEPKATDHKLHAISIERSEEETVRTRSVKLPEFKKGGGNMKGGGAGVTASSDSSDSGGSLLCSLAPRWLQAQRTRRPRRRDAPPAAAAPDPANTAPPNNAPRTDVTGGWSVTVAGSCRAALPADLEMRLRFPHERAPRAPHQPHDPGGDHSSDQECWCEWCRRTCRCCGCAGTPRAPGPCTRARAPLAAPEPPAPPAGKLTLTMKKEATDSSILASKTMKKSAEPLPDLETYKASRSKTKSSVKMRRGYSLHCWLPDAERAPLRTSNGLSVLGCAIIPELKPRVPTMSERDLTRAYTPRHYLRS